MHSRNAAASDPSNINSAIVMKTSTESAGIAGLSLLGADEAPAVTVERADGASDFVLACDHAGRDIPRALDALGLSETELASHIAWDIGAAGVARRLAERLDATLVLQPYSRLVIDCNRAPGSPESIVDRSEWTHISRNENLAEAEVEARTREIFQPYHDALRDILDARQRQRRQTILVSVHSFTPSYRGAARPWHIGIMYHRDARLAYELLRLLRRDERLPVGDNEPYSISDETDYTIPVHGEARGIPHVALEIRQDLIADEAGQATWAGRLAKLLKQASETLGAKA
jgi:predicted N-formylglutamate amidohydrolase